MSNCQLHLQLTEQDGENDLTENAEIHLSGHFLIHFPVKTIRIVNISITLNNKYTLLGIS